MQAKLDAAVAHWSANAPSLPSGPELAATTLSHFIGQGEALLAQLPPRPARTEQQLTLAAAIHAGSRALRRAFMQAHAVWLYRDLTDQFRTRPTITALAEAAARRIEGLVPGPDLLARERACRQRDKEGREIDQGIFFSALLADPATGSHLLESMRLPSQRALSLRTQFAEAGRLRLETLSIENIDAAAHITVHNGHCLNAEDDQLVADLETAVDLVLLTPAIAVGVLRGGVVHHPKYAGRRVFSAGINLKLLQSGQISYVDFLLRRELGFISKILRGLAGGEPCPAWDRPAREKPWIAAVDTFAIGGGAQLLLAFDHVIADSDSFFSLPAAQEGIVPGVANLRLPRAVGPRIARQIILSGRRLYASDADARLVFDQVVAPGAMEAAIAVTAKALAGPAVIANRRMLLTGEEPLETFRLYMAQFALEQALRLYSDDVLAKIEPA